MIQFNLNLFNLNLINKEGLVFPTFISSEFRMRQYRVYDHREEAPHFNGPLYYC